MLSLYIARDSALHRLSSNLKLTVLAVFALVLSFVGNLIVLAASLTVVLGLFQVAKLPLKTILTALRPALLMIAMLAVLQWAFATADAAISMVLRVGAIVLAAALLTYTTRFSDMIATLTQATRPLSLIGFSPAKIGLALALAIRFIPVLMTTYQAVQAARVSRGGGAFSFHALGPVLLNALRMTDEISDAVTARGFEERDERKE